MKIQSTGTRKNFVLASSLILLIAEPALSQSSGSIFDQINKNNSKGSKYNSSPVTQPTGQSSSQSAQPPSAASSITPSVPPASAVPYTPTSPSTPSSSAPAASMPAASGNDPNSASAYPAQAGVPSAYPNSSTIPALPIPGRAASALQNGIQNQLNHGVNALNKITRKAGLGGLGSLLNAPGAAAPGSAGYLAAPASSMPFLPNSIPGLPISTPPMAHGGDDGKAEFDAVARRAQAKEHQTYIDSAKRAESIGDWHQAAFAYRNAMSGETTQEDQEAAKRNNTGTTHETLKRLANDPQQKALNLRWAYCICRELSDQLAGKPSHVDPAHVGEQLFSAWESLKITDSDNAASWYYLCGVYWTKQVNSPSYNYVRALKELEAAEKCDHIPPSVKEKILTLKEHILPGKKLQILDTEKWSWDMRFTLISHWENNDIMTYNKETVDSTHYRNIPVYARQYYDSASYTDSKREVRDQYPDFKSRWDKYLAYLHTLPNKGISPPPGPNNEPVALYCPPQWEQLAFGPLDFKTGRVPAMDGAR